MLCRGNPHFFGSLFPKLASLLLHVFNVVDFVDDLGSKNGFDDILESDDSRKGSELIERCRDMNAVGNHIVEEGGEVNDPQGKDRDGFYLSAVRSFKL